MAFSGYAPEEFCAAGTERDCVERFFRWLQPDDVICCWQFETKNTLEALFRRSFSGAFSVTVLCMNKKVRAIAERRGIRCFPLYRIAEAAGLTVPAPEHRSSCDVSVMLALFQTLELPQEPPQTQSAKPPLSRQERNERIIANAGYTYLFSPASGCSVAPSKMLLRGAGAVCSPGQVSSVIRRRCSLRRKKSVSSDVSGMISGFSGGVSGCV